MSEGHRTIRENFEHALDLDPDDRAVFLDEACGDDAKLRRRVEALLAARLSSGGIARDAEDAETRRYAPLSRAERRLRVGALVGGKYRIDALVGEGGMGAVYRATDLRLERPVALKTIRGDRLADPAAAERFRREAIAVARLRHPNIVAVHDYGTAEDAGAYLAMEMIVGSTLREEIAEHGRFDVPTALAIAAQACAAVGAAHRAGVIHRGLKAANVVVERRGDDVTVKVVDFGLAKLEAAALSDGGGLTAKGAILGTPGYMSPEQCQGEEADARSDVYALGCIDYEALTGERPFPGTSALVLLYQHINETPRRPSELAAGLAPEVDEALMRALAKSPGDRHQTAEAFARALASTLPTESVGTRPAGNLPYAVTRFVGRERQIADVRDRLDNERLRTLVGPGGIGKTRLALEAAALVAGAYEDGVWLVELAPLADPALVGRAVASALGARVQAGGSATDAVAVWLQSRHALLVLDNCVHVVETCARLVEQSLSVAPRLHVLATSREPLGVTGENIWPVPALSLPSGSGGERDLECEAARLFVDRATLAKPDFEATAAVAEICRRLEGIPLAIELAAARVRAIPVEQFLARLDDRLRLLTGGGRGAPARQQTVRATLDWSYNLLTDEERAALRRLAVFAGGWTLETAEATSDGDDVLDMLTHLVDKSLVTALGASPVERIRMLEVVREYGLERLRECGEEDEVAGRHARVFLAVVRSAEHAAGTPRESEWLERIEVEHDNMRAALRWSVEHDPETGLRLAINLWNFWSLHGHFAEGERRLTKALETSDLAPSIPRAAALRAAGELAWRRGDRDAARARLEESLSIARAVGTSKEIAWSAFHLALLFQQQGEPRPSRPYLEECLGLGRTLDDRRLIGNALNSLGEAARMEEDWATARADYEQSLDVHHAMGHQAGVSLTLCTLGAVLCDAGDSDAAHACYVEAMPALLEVGTTMVLSLALDGLAAIAASRGEWERAAHTAGAAEALRDEVGAQRLHRRLCARVDSGRSAGLRLDRLGRAESIPGVAGPQPPGTHSSTG